MAVLAERAWRAGRPGGGGAFAAVLMVVVLIPLASSCRGVHGVDAPLPAVLRRATRPACWLLLAATLAPACALMQRLGTAQPLGAGRAGGDAGAVGHRLSRCRRCRWRRRTPASCSSALRSGARFTPAFARAAPRWLASVALGSLVMIGVSAGAGALLGLAAGLHPATGVLATAPGGIAEMCITAKVLRTGRAGGDGLPRPALRGGAAADGAAVPARGCAASAPAPSAP